MLASLKTLYNGRKALYGLIKCKLSRKRIPVRVSLLVTKYCNLKCFYCYTLDTLNSKEVQEPTLDNLKNIVDEVYKAGCCWIDILGGEPLLRDDIEELIDYIHSKGMHLGMNTNGFFVKKRIKALKKINYFCVSLDGDKESNDRNRGEGSFEKTVEGIEFAVKNGLKVRIHAALSRRTINTDSLRFLAGFCNRLKIKFNYSETGLSDIKKRLLTDLLFSEKDILSFYKKYKELKQKGYPLLTSNTAIEYATKWPLPGQTTIYKKDVDKIPKNSYYPCQLGRNQCFITADGYVYPCVKKWGHEYGKNLYEVGFQAAWDYLSDLDCVTCRELGNIEQSIITDLNPKALFNAITNFAL